MRGETKPGMVIPICVPQFVDGMKPDSLPSSVAAPSRVKARDMPHGAFVGRMRWGGYEYLYLPSPLLTKEGKGGAGIVNKLLNTYRDDRKGEVLAGFRPRTTRSFCVSAKGSKTIGAQAWPFGCLCPSPDCLGCGTRFAQTVLAPN